MGSLGKDGYVLTFLNSPATEAKSGAKKRLLTVSGMDVLDVRRSSFRRMIQVNATLLGAF
jgi:hypothetical protein